MSEDTYGKQETTFGPTLERFTADLKEWGTDERSEYEYETQIHRCLFAMEPEEALKALLRMEEVLPGEESRLCARMLVDEGDLRLRLKDSQRALRVLRDACAMSAHFRDYERMAQGSYLLAAAFRERGDLDAARRSALMCQKVIQHNLTPDHPLNDMLSQLVREMTEEPRETAPSGVVTENDPVEAREPILRVPEEAMIPSVPEGTIINAEIIENDPEEEADDHRYDGEMEQEEEQEPEEEPEEETVIELPPIPEEPEVQETPAAKEEAPPVQNREPLPAEPDEPEEPEEDEEEEDLPEEMILPEFRSPDSMPRIPIELDTHDLPIPVGFNRKGREKDDFMQAEQDARTACLVAAKNGMLTVGTELDRALRAQIDQWCEQGRMDEALLFLSELENALSADSFYRLEVSLLTGSTLVAAGDRIRAIGLYTHLLRELLQSVGPDDERTFSAMEILSDLYHQMGEKKREEDMRRLICRTLRENLPPDAPRLLEHTGKYMDALLASGNMAEAAEMYFADGVTEKQRKKLLGRLFRNEDYERAFAIYAKLEPEDERGAREWMICAAGCGYWDYVRYIWQRNTGLWQNSRNDHVREALENCGDAYAAKDMRADAAVLYQAAMLILANRQETEKMDVVMEKIAALDVRGTVLGRDDEAEREVVLADLNFGATKAEQAETVDLESVLEQETANAGAYDPAKLAAWKKQAADYAAKGDYQHARVLRGQIYRMRRNELGLEHPDTIAAMNNLAKSMVQAGELTDAVRLQREVVHSYANVMGPDHAYTITALSNLARTLERMGEYKTSCTVREQLYYIHRRKFGDDSRETIRARSLMERAARKCGKN